MGGIFSQPKAAPLPEAPTPGETEVKARKTQQQKARAMAQETTLLNVNEEKAKLLGE